jgi:hypothetical protein
MLRDPSATGVRSKYLGQSEFPAFVAICGLLVGSVASGVFSKGDSDLIAVFICLWLAMLWVWSTWARGNAINRTENEFKQAIPTWKDNRRLTALYLETMQCPGRTALTDQMDYLRQSEAVNFMLNRMEDVCRHDSHNLFGHAFFEENFWRMLKLYWLYAHDLIIEEQTKDHKKWRHIFPTYRKYRSIFNDHPTPDQIARLGCDAMLLRERGITE